MAERSAPPPDRELKVGFAWFDREQWQRLTEVVEDRAELDDTYEQWHKSAREAFADLEREGVRIEKVHVKVDALVAWCRAQGLPVNGEARSQYVAMVVRQRRG
jgi:hypothetical protein